MRTIGVLDLRGGLAVHARGGERAGYAPVSAAGLRGDPLATARFYRARCGVAGLYAADLDALAGGEPQWDCLGALGALGAPLLVDAAAATPGRARQLLAAVGGDVARVIVALECLPSISTLRVILARVGARRIVFGLDLRAGVPMTRPGAPSGGDPLALVGAAVDAGVHAVLVVDVARAGGEAGVDVSLLARIRQRWPDLELLAGGGVRDRADLEGLAALGCSGALVATALLDGRIGREDVAGLATGSGAERQEPASASLVPAPHPHASR